MLKYHNNKNLEMKNLFYFIIILTVFSCKENKDSKIDFKQKENNVDALNGNLNSETKEQLVFDESLLSGVWGIKKNENALFYIENDSVFYIESQEKGYLVRLENRNFSIHYDDYIFNTYLIKLNKDSLVYKIENDKIMRLIRFVD